jgi:hypothetical protein
MKPLLACLSLVLLGVAARSEPLEMLTPATVQDFSSFFSGNGSFELGEYAAPLIFPRSSNGDPITRTFTSNAVIGWRLFGGNTSPRWLEGPDAQDGNRYIGLSAWFGSGRSSTSALIDGWSISHTPFTPGEIYELSFWAAGGVGSNNRVSVQLNGHERYDFDLRDYTASEREQMQGLEWQQFTIPFVAKYSSMSLSIAPTYKPGPTLRSTVFLDNFSITPIPEPGSALLTIFAGAVLMMTRQRRNKSAY